jgi:hypothetical protein
MEQQPAMSWPEQIHENPLVEAPDEDEFSNFLEFNMQFADLEGHGPAHSQMQDQQHSMVPTTTTAPESAIPSDQRSQSHHYSAPIEGLAMDFGGHGPVQSHNLSYSTPSMTPGFSAQDSSQQPTNHHYMQGQPMIPPTPNSIELHGNAARYSQRVDESADMYDRYSRINEDQVCSRVPHSFCILVNATHICIQGSIHSTRFSRDDTAGESIPSH